MQSTAAIVAILISSVIQFFWNGLLHMVILKDMEEQAFSQYASLMHQKGQEPSMWLWLMPSLVGTWFLLHILVRRPGTISLKDAIVSGIVLTLVLDAIMNSSMYMYFANFPVQMSLIGMAADVITGAIAGASLILVYNAMAKKA